MRCISTRGQAPPADFETVLLSGLAPDGGLYVAEQLPRFDAATIRSWQGLSYIELAMQILPKLVDIPEDRLETMVSLAYGSFDCAEVVPLIQLGEAKQNLWLLELFHGPTFSFKDCAMQLLARMLEGVLSQRGQRALIIGATSGDTGSAAIAACQHCSNADVVMLHPKGRVSDMQRLQMTTQLADNVHNLALQGSFDDCQAIVKQCFGDPSLRLPGVELVAVNSINWGRVVAQTIYYFYAHLKLGAPRDGAVYSVPTGNFGNAYAGYLANRMGLPMRQLVVSVNANQVLHQFFSTGKYERGTVVQTQAPSMDIAVASNLERLIFDIYGRDGEQVARLMKQFADQGSIGTDPDKIATAAALFYSVAVNDQQSSSIIAEYHSNCGYFLDPHSAIAVAGGCDGRRQLGLDSVPLVCLATAHPAKFPQAIETATGQLPPVPSQLEGLQSRRERCHSLPARFAEVRQYLAQLLATHNRSGRQ